VIGKFLPLPKLKTAIRKISTDARQFTDFDPVRAARAIMTTDTRPKVAGTTINLGGEQVTIWGCAKGAGMIHPNMATMLSFIFTDALIAPAADLFSRLVFSYAFINERLINAWI
jgi:glutamate N-acetyltransferase/amino-acid N-acetyltransferase